MYIIKESREDLLKVLPAGCVGAEIGVAEGYFTRHILRHTAPRRLYLVDCWRFQEEGTYVSDMNNVCQKKQDERYHDVLREHAQAIAAGNVVVLRMFSAEAASRLERGSLDWLYLDANHTYDAVRADLELYVPAMKRDGIVCGHDYSNSPWAARMDFGVVEAVNDFARKHGFAIVALTKEIYPSYMMMRPGAALEAMRRKITSVLTVEREVSAPVPETFNIVFKTPGLLSRILGKYLLRRPDPDETFPDWAMRINGEEV